ncbi:MAG: hypothetical protein Ct9H300mP7_5030 [Verrucomicrobiota bacterium]|nr:MAG: hypothetical protein Ct9H300mP7_5030 [Verrucomicrobiota bacterium]
MPPRKNRNPSRRRKRLLNWLDWEINHFDYSQVDNPGYEPVRRLTHIEFSKRCATCGFGPEFGC